MRSDLDKHIERHLKDKEFKIYFEKAEAKRIESPNDKRMPSLEFLDRIAKAFNRKLVISLQR